MFRCPSKPLPAFKLGNQTCDTPDHKQCLAKGRFFSDSPSRYTTISLAQATVTVEPPLFCCAASMAMAMELGYYAAMGSFRAVVEAKGLSLKPDMRAQREVSSPWPVGYLPTWS